MTFAYTALDASGKRKSGFLDAANRDVAASMIAADGRFVLELREETSSRNRQTSSVEGGEQRRKGKPSRSDLALFSRRMADLAAAGLPLDRVLQVVAEQSESEMLAEVAEKVLTDVRSGRPVSEALASFPKLFPVVYTSTLRAGEASGQFAEVAGRLAEFQEKEVTRRSQVTSALVYPVILTIVAVFVVIFLLTFVVPKLQGVFTSLGNDLPLATKVLLAMTSFLTTNYLLILGSIAGAIVGYRLWTATEPGAMMRDQIFLRLPVAGSVIRKATVSRFANVLGTLVYGGVPILDALNLAGLASGNRVFQLSADTVQDEVRDGRAIHEAMRDSGAFPPVLTHMVAIGEETGDLPKMLGRVSDSLDFEVENGMRRLTSVVEPIIILGMGGFVGFVVLAVLLPIFAAQDLVK